MDHSELYRTANETATIEDKLAGMSFSSVTMSDKSHQMSLQDGATVVTPVKQWKPRRCSTPFSNERKNVARRQKKVDNYDPLCLWSSIRVKVLAVMFSVFYLGAIGLSAHLLSTRSIIHPADVMILCVSLFAVLSAHWAFKKEQARYLLPLLTCQVVFGAFFCFAFVSKLIVGGFGQESLARHFFVFVYSSTIVSIHWYMTSVILRCYTYFRVKTAQTAATRARVIKMALDDLNDDLVVFDRSDSFGTAPALPSSSQPTARSVHFSHFVDVKTLP